MVTACPSPLPVTLPTYLKLETRLLQPRSCSTQQITLCSIRGTDAASTFNRVRENVMNFSSTTLLLSLLIAIVGGSASARGIAVENLDASCHADPMTVSRSEGRWTYRTMRATGQKCWFVGADSRRSRPHEQRILILAYNGTGSGLVQSQTSRCLASPNGPSPGNTHWRYRLEKAGQKCWYLAGLSSKRSPATRTRTRLSNKASRPKKDENQGKKNDLKQLRTVANTNDSLLAGNGASPRDTPNAGRADKSEDSLNEAPPPNFDARWLASPPANQSVALSKVAPAIPPDIQSPAPTDSSLTANPTAVDSGMMPRFSLAIIGSVAIAMGLFTLVNGAIRFQMSRSYAVGSPGFDQSLPKDNSSIADILERLNEEDQS
jgi:hypothetical protein